MSPLAGSKYEGQYFSTVPPHLYITLALLRSGTDSSAENKIKLINLDIWIPKHYWGVIPPLAAPLVGQTPRDLVLCSYWSIPIILIIILRRVQDGHSLSRLLSKIGFSADIYH